ncbi:hypothetical protein ASE66_08685 [Bosea sp. Root483D1]|uniref:autotransporter outer membrane beta-barrel domain-containing protein n=1 Tax=Bosea sp. Root483D1 TaxID=1736544 RepID=UPI00071011F4|nr:autotransporter domain-containing protein [Bosea sp. Root483D1]KRE16692.1 hypothetical protein ASE66_08685 [Bosea sp. Root483D1]
MSTFMQRVFRSASAPIAPAGSPVLGVARSLSARGLLALASPIVLSLGAGTIPGAAQDAFIDGGLAVTVPSGQPSPWLINGTLVVGATSAGTLQVEAGGQVGDINGYIGFGGASHGIAIVTGSNSLWSNSNDLLVGIAGRGELTVANGGQVRNVLGFIGYNSGSHGVAAVTGAGSLWANSGDLYIGTAGQGVLAVMNGGQVRNTYGLLGYFADSTGTVTVTGAGSLWANSLGIAVGESGTGTLTIADGGRVESGGTGSAIGDLAGSRGTATVTGANAIWANSSILIIGNLGSGALTIANGGRVESGRSYIGGVASGSGSATVSGAGSVWSVMNEDLLVGFAGRGALTVSAGGRVQNNWATIGSLGGSIGSVVVIGQNSTWANSRRIAVGEAGAGTLTITAGGLVSAQSVVVAANAGSTGTLNIGAASTEAAMAAGVLQAGGLGFGSGNGRLVFNHTGGNYDFTLPINGLGRIDHLAGVTHLSGDSSGFSGTTVVSGGTLGIDGKLGGLVDLRLGGRLQGTGTITGNFVANGGTIAPGNSIGTLTVNGAYVQNAGTVYEVEVDPGTVTSDRIQVHGNAMLANGAAVLVINYTGAAYVAGQRYTILTSTGLSGSYGADIAIGPILSLRNSTDATNAYLTVVQTNTAGGIGGTGNEQAVGQAVDSLPTGNAAQTGVYNQASLDAARRALGQLSGEIHASARAVLVDESWLLRAAVNDRLRSAFGTVGSSPMATLSYGFTADLAPRIQGAMPRLPAAERFAVWGQGYGSWGRTSSDGNAASLSRSTGGLLVGADAAVLENLRLGVVAGYSRTQFDVNRRLSSGESDNYHLGLYGGGQFGALSLRTGLSYTWHDLSTRRGIVAAGLGDTLRAGYDAGTAQAFGELGYRIEFGQVAFEPFAGLAYVVLRSDGFTERGGAAALSSGSDDTGLGYATLGLRAATTTRLAGADLTLRGGLGWRHAFGDVDPKTTLAFTGSNPFSISGLPIARNAALLEAGLGLSISPSATLSLAYTAQLAQDTQDHAFKANLAVRF